MIRQLQHVAAALALSASVARGGRAQDARLAAIGDADVRAAIGTLIVDAERAGLPREPLVVKALEGVEKKAPPPRIEAAVRALAARLAVARVALGPLASGDELRAGADALAAGAPADALRAVRAAAPNRPTAVPLGVLAQLSARGVPARDAASAVTELVRRGAGHAQLLALQRAVQNDLAAGIPAATALDLGTRAIIAALPAPPPVITNSTIAPAGKP